MTPVDLRQRAAVLETEARDLVTSIAAENRDLTTDEQAEIDRRTSEADRLTRQAETIEGLNARLESRSASTGRVSSPVIEAGESAEDKYLRTGGFKSHGHFAHTVLKGNRSEASDDDRAPLLKYRSTLARVRAASGLNITVGPEGGDLVPPEQSTAIWAKTYELDTFSNRITFMPIGGNTFPLLAESETSRANGSRGGGLRCYNQAEASQLTSSKPSFENRELKLKNYTCLVYMTGELQEDFLGLDSYLGRRVPEEFAFKLSDDAINGNGVGMFLGIMNSPALVTVTKESGQTAATVVAENILKMHARAWGPSRRNMSWFINQDLEPQLPQMKIATGSSSGTLVYMPPNGLSDSPYGTLLGRPVVPIEQCQTLGTTGDIIFADPTQIMGIRKSSGMKTDVSIHLRFDYNEVAFRYMMRLDAQPAWSSPLTPFKGTNTQSPFIALQTRS